jgi:hypothetical protein
LIGDCALDVLYLIHNELLSSFDLGLLLLVEILVLDGQILALDPFQEAVVINQNLVAY